MKATVNEFNTIGNKINNKTIGFKQGMEKRLNLLEETIELIDRQIKSLKKAKQFTKSDVDRKYLDLLLENRAKLKEFYESYNKQIIKHMNVSDANGVMPLGDMIIVINLLDKVDDKSSEVDKTIDTIKDFLEDKPNFKIY